MASQFRHLIALARPRHWVKNGIVLLPIVFGQRAGEPAAWWHVAVAFAAFCLASSAGYALNDLCDAAADRAHPTKRTRPIASGQVGRPAAAILAAALAAGALAVGAVVGVGVLALVAAYLALQAAYSVYLKTKMLLDVMTIAGGFVLRAAAGALAIPVWVSPWLVVCTFTLCLFLGFCKRRMEAGQIADASAARAARPTLANYTTELLTHLITLSATIAVISYLLYASHPATTDRLGTVYMVYTLPIVIYAVGRFAMLSMIGRWAGPTELILRDRPFQASVGLWLASVFLIVYRGRAIHEWLARHAF